MNKLWAPHIYTLDGFVRENILGDATALDVGCGSKKLPGSTGMDVLSLPGVDVVHDVNKVPWPLANDSFDLVFLNHALEHVVDVIAVMDEIHRVLRPHGHVVIQVPYFRSVDAYTDPTHKHFFTSGTLDYVIAGSELGKYHYSKNLFRKAGFWFGWPHVPRNPLRRTIKEYMHAYPDRFDRVFSQILPVACLTWELEKLA